MVNGVIKRSDSSRVRLRIISIFFFVVTVWIVVRLFVLQIVQHDAYAFFALNSHEIYQKIHAERGKIFFKDSRTGKEYPAAINKTFYLVHAVPREMAAEEIPSTTQKIIALLGYTDEEKKQGVINRLNKKTSAYQVVDRKVPEEVYEKIQEARLKGVYGTPQEYRYYPEEHLASNVLGFCSVDERGTSVGHYGLEEYWNNKLAGNPGYIAGERGRLGSWITLAGRKVVTAENGADLVLTIDRALQSQACRILEENRQKYSAEHASLVLMNPATGAVLAMCSFPDFDPNNYAAAPSLDAYNNQAIYGSYEPGSVFKTFTMAAGIDLGLISPGTTFTDPCKRVINGFTVRNADGKCYGEQTMTGVLENSINTGVVWVEEKLGNTRFKDYIEKFGFGQKTGITVNTEVAGDISSLSKKGQIFGANGSFGQGLTATPLQLAVAYSAVANGGKLLKPYLVEEVRYASGKVEKTVPQLVEQILSPRTTELLKGMLTSVIERHSKGARLPGYYLAGKTGTAQIASRGGYSATDTNHTFAGFGPVDKENPFVLVVTFNKPARRWAEDTASPVFKQIMKFVLDYYEVPKEKNSTASH